MVRSWRELGERHPSPMHKAHQSALALCLLFEDGQAALTIKAPITPGVPDEEEASRLFPRCEELFPDEKVNLEEFELPLPNSERAALERPRTRHAAAMSKKGNSATINSRLVHPPVMHPGGATAHPNRYGGAQRLYRLYSLTVKSEHGFVPQAGSSP